MKRLIVGLVSVLACTVAITADADEIANGGFETGNISDWTWFPDANMSDVVMFDVYGGDGASFAFQVNPTLAAGGNGATVGSLTQWFQLDGGTSYTVSWEQGMQNIGGYPMDLKVARCDADSEVVTIVMPHCGNSEWRARDP